MQTIDPIKPFRPLRGQRPKMVDPGPPPSPRGPSPQFIDGFVTRSHPQSTASAPTTRQFTTTLQPTMRQHQSLQPTPQQLELPKKTPAPQTISAPITNLSYSLKKKIIIGSILVIIAVVTAVLVYVPFGQILALLYGAVVLIKRIPSRITFLLALVTLALVPITLLLFGQNLLSSALATNAYILLVIGVITLAIELRKDSTAAQTL